MTRIDNLIAAMCPDGVPFKMLSEVVLRNIGGGTPSRSVDAYWGGDIPWASVGDLSMSGIVVRGTRATITHEGLENSPSHLIMEGDIIVATKISPGRMKIAGVDMAINQDLRGLTLSDEIDAAFLVYYFETLSIVGNGTIVKGITTDALQRIRVPVPPLAIQREVAAILQTMESLKVELEAELKAELEYRSRQYAHYRAQVLDVSSLEPTALIREVVNFSNARAHEKLVDPAGTVALMTARFVSRGEANRFVRPENVLTPAFEGDVALVMSDLPNGRALARTYYVEEDGKYAANQRVCLLRSMDTDTLRPRFLHHVMNRNPQLLSYNNGVDQTHLKKDYILDVRIPVPPVEEQDRIVAVIDRFDALMNDLSSGLPAEIEARRRQYEYYRAKLLTFEESA